MFFEFAKSDEFDVKLAMECTTAFHNSTGLPCTISSITGEIIAELGGGCSGCSLCKSLKGNLPDCNEVHRYGMGEAERFGGRYIYFCPNGLTFFVSPILGSLGSVAKITVGPFLMVEPEDFISFELEQRLGLKGEELRKSAASLGEIKQLEPQKVEPLSILLFLSVSFISNVWGANQMLEAKSTGEMQGNISDYVFQLKRKAVTEQYPIDVERALMRSITACDRDSAVQQLNELLGNILFSSGGDLSRIKSRIYELLVLISRAAVDGGAEPEYSLQQNHRYMQEIQSINSLEKLCSWISDVMRRFMDDTFELAHMKHMDTIHKAVQYVRRHYDEKITLEEVAREVYLSPSYFSKIFKEEMGCTFSGYLNRIRVEKSKKLLMEEGNKLVDIAVMVGFDDQSYFTRVFKRITGVSPSRYRKSKGRNIP